MDMTTMTATDQADNPVIRQMFNMGHEQVVFCQDEASGLKAIIGIHNTILGPALGGTRMWTYENEMAALNDVLRLSRGMSYKNAIAGLQLGGGKAVIIGDARTQKNEALMRRFGKFVNSLSGKYITAEDVGMTTLDMEYIHMETDHVVGLPKSQGGSGDPSPVTAYGTYMGMKASAKVAYGSDSLAGKKVMVQGAGNVGRYLIDHLVKEGAMVMVSDIFEDKIKMVTDVHSAVQVVPADQVFTQEMDIYAPCALGATVNDASLEQLKCQIIAGAANNQLADEQRHGNMVREKGVIYAPDYVINAGGVINCFAEVAGYDSDWSLHKAEHIYNTTLDIIQNARSADIPSYEAANRLAEERIAAIGKVQMGY